MSGAILIANGRIVSGPPPVEYKHHCDVCGYAYRYSDSSHVHIPQRPYAVRDFVTGAIKTIQRRPYIGACRWCERRIGTDNLGIRLHEIAASMDAHLPQGAPL